MENAIPGHYTSDSITALEERLKQVLHEVVNIAKKTAITQGKKRVDGFHINQAYNKWVRQKYRERIKKS